uniref:Uncharacterized protein n=1 Tax=Zea mays TaxID=4577 RepID=C4J0K4_MAIZE|nr:unknown [Zea mays]
MAKHSWHHQQIYVQSNGRTLRNNRGVHVRKSEEASEVL